MLLLIHPFFLSLHIRKKKPQGSGNRISSASAPRSIGIATTAAPPPTTTDDTPDFDRAKVSLDVPDQLFGSSFNTVTNVSKLFGDLMMVSFRSRKHRHAKRLCGLCFYFPGLCFAELGTSLCAVCAVLEAGAGQGADGEGFRCAANGQHDHRDLGPGTGEVRATLLNRRANLNISNLFLCRFSFVVG